LETVNDSTLLTARKSKAEYDERHVWSDRSNEFTDDSQYGARNCDTVHCETDAENVTNKSWKSNQ
jgi:hypothetical protein